MKENKHTPVLDIIIFIIAVALLVVCTGCTSPKSRHLDIAGAYVNQSGTVAVGSIEVQSAPEGVESAMVSYEDEKAWFSNMKEHSIRILLTGTNAVTAADGIVSNICAAFTATAPSLSPARTSAKETTSVSPVVKKGDATGTAGDFSF